MAAVAYRVPSMRLLSDFDGARLGGRHDLGVVGEPDRLRASRVDDLLT